MLAKEEAMLGGEDMLNTNFAGDIACRLFTKSASCSLVMRQESKAIMSEAQDVVEASHARLNVSSINADRDQNVGDGIAERIYISSVTSLSKTPLQWKWTTVMGLSKSQDGLPSLECKQRR